MAALSLGPEGAAAGWLDLWRCIGPSVGTLGYVRWSVHPRGLKSCNEGLVGRLGRRASRRLLWPQAGAYRLILIVAVDPTQRSIGRL